MSGDSIQSKKGNLLVLIFRLAIKTIEISERGIRSHKGLLRYGPRHSSRPVRIGIRPPPTSKIAGSKCNTIVTWIKRAVDLESSCRKHWKPRLDLGSGSL